MGNKVFDYLNNLSANNAVDYFRQKFNKTKDGVKAILKSNEFVRACKSIGLVAAAAGIMTLTTGCELHFHYNENGFGAQFTDDRQPAVTTVTEEVEKPITTSPNGDVNIYIGGNCTCGEVKQPAVTTTTEKEEKPTTTTTKKPEQTRPTTKPTQPTPPTTQPTQPTQPTPPVTQPTQPTQPVTQPTQPSTPPTTQPSEPAPNTLEQMIRDITGDPNVTIESVYSENVDGELNNVSVNGYYGQEAFNGTAIIFELSNGEQYIIQGNYNDVANVNKGDTFYMDGDQAGNNSALLDIVNKEKQNIEDFDMNR